eukprot:2515885-Rhodomonas_salina.3
MPVQRRECRDHHAARRRRPACIRYLSTGHRVARAKEDRGTCRRETAGGSRGAGPAYAISVPDFALQTRRLILLPYASSVPVVAEHARIGDTMILPYSGLSTGHVG